MEENKNKEHAVFIELLVRKRKLIELRNAISEKKTNIVERKGFLRNQTNEGTCSEKMVLDQQSSPNAAETDKIVLSPIPPMSPETKQLYDTLANEPEIYDNLSLPSSPVITNITNEESDQYKINLEALKVPITTANLLEAEEISSKSNIASLPYPLLMPENKSDKLLLMSDKMSVGNQLESDLPENEPGEKSIEAPPYSPLTPRPMHANSNASLIKKNISNAQPNTDLIEHVDNNFFSDNCPEYDIYNNDDDSVQDPDFVCDETDISSDDSSGISVSILQVQADIHNFEAANNNSLNNNIESVMNEVATNHNIENINCHQDTAEISIHPISQDNIEKNCILDKEILSDSPEIGAKQKSGRPSKGRKNKFGGLNREERKKRKYMNLSYVNSRKKNIEPKPFLDWKCSCHKKCHELISVENRLAEFNKFYALGSYNAQNMYLAACVNEQPVKRSYVSTNKTNISKKKTFSRQYILQGQSVCREMFVKTLQTTPKRINTSLCKMRSEDSIIDKRGKQAGLNRIALEQEQFFINFVEKLPKYVSHYRRNEYNDAKFLRPDMTFRLIYKQYCQESTTAGIQPISNAKAKQIFLTQFNLRTKSLKKDTCKKCDSFAIKKSQASGDDKIRIEEEHSVHLEKANSLQQQLRADMLLAKDPNQFTETITYDLEKTLPLPRIPTNVVFYKRQLWVYNLGIHTGSNDQAYCNVWVEGEAGRGAQEIASCLLKHIAEKLKPDVRYLILWSDSAGGQNRNIKLTLMLKAMLCDHPTLQQISIRFLESGHSFLPNDTDFGRIECALKLQQRLYTPQDYIEIMKNCKKNKPMHVTRMTKEDFLSCSKLENIITNRKIAVDKSKISWLKTKELVLKKEHVFSIYMRTDLEADFKELNIKKNTRGRQPIMSKNLMDSLWPNGKPIPSAKLEDIRSLLHLIPNDVHNFYKNLTGDDRIVDDIDGFSGAPDFEFELDEPEE